ncbi:MAG: methyltransferase domain-containing protein [Nitrososphaeraceae archaeon]
MGDIYKEQTGRYEFVSKFVSGRILDITYGSFMAYQSAKILLSSGATEVWNCDISNDVQYSKRTLGTNNIIEFEMINEVNFPDGYFNCIISSETIQHSKDCDFTLKEFYRILKHDGILVISSSNKKESIMLYGKSNQWNDSTFSKDEFLKLIEKTFPSVRLYSQRLITRTEILERRLHSLFSLIRALRKLLSIILLKFDKSSNFYQRYLQRNIIKMNSTIDKINQDILSIKYQPIPFQESHRALFFIAICRKNNNN